PAAYGVIGAGPVVRWGGRRSIGLGAPASGAITLGDGHTFDGGGLHLTSPISLPWIFRYLGPFDMELLLTRAENGDGIGVTGPWPGAMRLSIPPHERPSMGATRAGLVGGEDAAPLTAPRPWPMPARGPSGRRGGRGRVEQRGIRLERELAAARRITAARTLLRARVRRCVRCLLARARDHRRGPSALRPRSARAGNRRRVRVLLRCQREEPDLVPQ